MNSPVFNTHCAFSWKRTPTHTRGKWRSRRHLKHDMTPPHSVGQLGITLHEAVITRPISHHAMLFFWSLLVTEFYSIWHLSMPLLGAHLTKTYQLFIAILHVTHNEKSLQKAECLNVDGMFVNLTQWTHHLITVHLPVKRSVSLRPCQRLINNANTCV